MNEGPVQFFSRTLVGMLVGVAGTLGVGWIMLSGRYVTREELPGLIAQNSQYTQDKRALDLMMTQQGVDIRSIDDKVSQIKEEVARINGYLTRTLAKEHR